MKLHGGMPVLRTAIVAMLIAVGAPASAEVADKDQPVNIEADQVTVDDAKQTSVFTGNVIVTQGTMQLRADRLVVKHDETGFRHGTAYGKQAYFRQKRSGYDDYVEGFGDRIEYDAGKETLELYVRARIKRGEDEVRGSEITYNAITEQYRVTGGKDSAAEGGRVRAIIQPRSRNGEAGGSTGPEGRR